MRARSSSRSAILISSAGGFVRICSSQEGGYVIDGFHGRPHHGAPSRWTNTVHGRYVPAPMKSYLLTALAAVSLVLSGCVASSKKLAEVSPGMNKDEVVKILGQPKSVSLRDGSEFMRYQLSGRYTHPLAPTDARFADGYTVQLVDGKVVAYGRDDEFQPVRVQVSDGPQR